MGAQIRVYIASSLDGFIAGPKDELDWLGDPTPDAGLPDNIIGFERFISDVGAMVMGRGTYDVVSRFDPPWFYGNLPILVPTHRPLSPVVPSVRAVAGTIDEVLDDALRLADGKDVYVDGGATIRQALDAGRIDEIVLTIAPVLLGRGKPLFAGLEQRHHIDIVSHRDYGRGMMQLIARPVGSYLRT
ncbi:MAG: dihydrofolate reductase family protein [Gemmatimonadaceae bacterium]